MMRRIAIAFVIGVFVPGLAFAQSAKDLLKGASDTGNVLNYGMGYDLKRFSTLDQINKKTVKNLVPVWAYGLESGQSQESQPIVYKGVIYITTENATMAVSAKTGRQI